MSTHRELVISIHPEYAYLEMIGKKILEVRTWIPKDYKGWVNVYVTGAKLKYLKRGEEILRVATEIRGMGCHHVFKYFSLNHHIAYRFWFEQFDQSKNDRLSKKWILENLCLNEQQFEKLSFGKEIMYFWYINKLEIFDRPRSLSEFGLKKAPQKCAWVQVED